MRFAACSARFDWLGDEVEALANGEADVGAVQALMAAAVADYLSIPLWVQRLE